MKNADGRVRCFLTFRFKKHLTFLCIYVFHRYVRYSRWRPTSRQEGEAAEKSLLSQAGYGIFYIFVLSSKMLTEIRTFYPKEVQQVLVLEPLENFAWWLVLSAGCFSCTRIISSESKTCNSLALSHQTTVHKPQTQEATASNYLKNSGGCWQVEFGGEGCSGGWGGRWIHAHTVWWSGGGAAPGVHPWVRSWGRILL